MLKVFISKKLFFSIVLTLTVFLCFSEKPILAQEIKPIVEVQQEKTTINFAKVKRNGKYNILDVNGSTILNEDVDNVWSLGKDVLVVKQGKKYGFYSVYGHAISDVKFDSYKNLTKEGMIAVCEKKQWGFINTKGEEVIPLQFTDVFSFNEGMAAVKNGKQWGFIDTNGQFVIPAKFKNAKSFNEDFAPVSTEKKWGYIDKTGKSVIAEQYSEAQIFSEDLAAVKNGGKWVYINKTGKEQFTAPYKTVTPFYGNLAEVRVKVSKVSMLGIAFNVFSNIIGNMGNNSYIGVDYGFMEENEKRGYINKTGELVITTKNDFVDVYNGNKDSLILFVNKNKWGLADSQGNVVVPAEYEKLSYFKEGFAIVANDGKYNFININNERLNKNDYTDVKPFQNDRAAVQFGEKWGYVKNDGVTAIRAKFEKANSFYNGVATVQFNNKWRIINKEDDTIKELTGIDEILNFTGGFAPIRKDKLWGYMDVQGNIVIEPQFQDASYFEEIKI